MGKINYSKAEREMLDALQRMQVRNLAEGKTITSRRAEEFYGIKDESPRPIPEEPVAKLLREEAAEDEAAQNKSVSESVEGEVGPQMAKPSDDEVSSYDSTKRPPIYDVLKKTKPQSTRLPRSVAAPPPEIPSSDTFFEPTSRLYVLRQHILWLKRKHFDNRYELLGTTKDEVMSFRRANRLSQEQIARINEINAHAEEVKAGILAEQGMKTEETQIEHQKQKHKTKRFNIKETWLPL